MAADMGTELKAHNITCISLWPGAVETEVIKTSEHGAAVRNSILFIDKRLVFVKCLVSQDAVDLWEK